MKHSASMLLVLALVAMTSVTSFADAEVGGDLKVLSVWTDNTWDLDDEYGDDAGFMRMEGHLWFEAELEENVMARISVEFDRDFSDLDGLSDCGESCDGGFSDYGFDRSSDLDIFLEEAYIKASGLFGGPWEVTVGRMFLMFGTGFVVGDALPFSPVDVSCLGEKEQDPFDGILVDFDLSDTAALSLAYTKVLETRWSNEDIDVLMANLAIQAIENVDLEVLYLFYSIDGTCGLDDDSFERADVHQIGVRAASTIEEWLELNGEFSYQFAGEIETNGDKLDIEGFALELGAKVMPEAMAANQGAIGFTFTWLSGDEYDQDDDYDRYIQLLDNRTYGEIADYYSGLVSNDAWDDDFHGVFIFNLDGEVTVNDLRLAAEIYYFLAEEDIYDEDDEIGWEIDFFAEYPITEDLKAHAAAGFFAPGDGTEDYFGDENLDTAVFVRGGVTVSF